MANAAAHDINYIALTGALHAIGSPEAPLPPLNLVADFGGGGVYLAFGVVSALLEAMKSGKGQVVDAAMVDGASSLMASCYGAYAAGNHLDQRGMNRLDGGCHHYNVYETKDGKHISVGSNEPQFYAMLIEALGLDLANLPAQADRSHWPEMKERIAGLNCKHDSSHNSVGQVRKGFQKTYQKREDTPGAVHPLVAEHPETGRKVIYLGRRARAYICELEKFESDALLDDLFAHITRPQFTWTQKWRLGDVVIWDNRCTLHRRDALDPNERRLLHRAQIKDVGRMSAVV